MKKIDSVDKFCIDNEVKTVKAVFNMAILRLKSLEEDSPDRFISHTISALETTLFQNEVASMYAYAILQSTQNDVVRKIGKIGGAVELPKYDSKEIEEYVKRKDRIERKNRNGK